MSTHATAIPNIGELRFIFRLNRANLNKGYAVSDVKGCDTKIEGSDVFECVSPHPFWRCFDASY
jgi:hypothetical protein